MLSGIFLYAIRLHGIKGPGCLTAHLSNLRCISVARLPPIAAAGTSSVVCFLYKKAVIILCRIFTTQV